MNTTETKLITGTIAPDTKLTAQTNPQSVSLDSSMTFHTGSREVLRITNEARLIIGEGLSKDETTQEVANMLIVAFDEQIQKMLDKRVASIKSELEKMVLIAGLKADSNVELRMRAEKAEKKVEQLTKSLMGDNEGALLVSDLTEKCQELKARAEKAEAESNKLLEHGIQAFMIARSWAMVWGDKLSPDSVALFTKHEQEFLSAKETNK